MEVQGKTPIPGVIQKQILRTLNLMYPYEFFESCFRPLGLEDEGFGLRSKRTIMNHECGSIMINGCSICTLIIIDMIL